MNPKKLSNYIEQAEVVAKNSHDAETQVGLLLVGEGGEIILTTYNGFVPGAPDSKLPCTRPDKYEYISHAEANAVYQAAKRGISIDKCVAICTLSPCVKCCRMLWSCGISTIYFKDKYRDFDHNKQMLDLGLHLEEVGDYYKLVLYTKKA